MNNKILLQKNLEILAETGVFKEVSYSSETETTIVVSEGKIIKREGNIVIQNENGNKIEIPEDGLKEIVVLEERKIVDIRGIKDNSKISTVFFFKENGFESYLERLRQTKLVRNED